MCAKRCWTALLSLALSWILVAPAQAWKSALPSTHRPITVEAISLLQRFENNQYPDITKYQDDIDITGVPVCSTMLRRTEHTLMAIGQVTAYSMRRATMAVHSSVGGQFFGTATPPSHSTTVTGRHITTLGSWRIWWKIKPRRRTQPT